MRRGLMIVVTAVSVAVWCVGAASAAAGWVIQTTPNPAGASGSVLNGVSCTSPTSCTAVGSYFAEPAGTLSTLAEYWNGSTWAIQATPNPAGASGSVLNGISCTLPTSCTAVGFYSLSGGNPLTLAEHWNGSSWAIQATPNPAGTGVLSELGGVSCGSATRCTAVGWYARHNNAGPPHPLAEHWNGSGWAIQAAPIPAGSTGTSLGGVSCASPTSCTAVGSYSNSGGTPLSLAEHWNGSSWAIQAIPSPAGSPDSRLGGVSCHSATSCTAVGRYYISGGTPLSLAEHWNGSSWAIQATPNPAPSLGASLSGVSCVSANSCTAVGANEGQAAGFRPLAEHWNGSTWAIQFTPPPSGSRNATLGGVSCTLPTSCTAVGGYSGGTLAEAR